jgi:hypothetical protein
VYCLFLGSYDGTPNKGGPCGSLFYYFKNGNKRNEKYSSSMLPTPFALHIYNSFEIRSRPLHFLSHFFPEVSVKIRRPLA